MEKKRSRSRSRSRSKDGSDVGDSKRRKIDIYQEGLLDLCILYHNMDRFILDFMV